MTTKKKAAPKATKKEEAPKVLPLTLDQRAKMIIFNHFKGDNSVEFMKDLGLIRCYSEDPFYFEKACIELMRIFAEVARLSYSDDGSEEAIAVVRNLSDLLAFVKKKQLEDWTSYELTTV